MHFTCGPLPGNLEWQPAINRFAIIKEFLEFLRERKKLQKFFDDGESVNRWLPL